MKNDQSLTTGKFMIHSIFIHVEVIMKVCTVCELEKDINCFSVTKRNKDGSVRYRNSWCNQCRSEAQLKAKGGRVKPIPRVEGNCKECLTCKKLLNKNEFSPSKRGRLGVAAYCKRCIIVRKPKDSETKRKVAETTKAYRIRHLLRWRAMHRIHQFNRRSLIKATEDGTVTDKFLEELYQKEYCYWCNNFIENENRTIEHIEELTSGGKHSAENLTMACLSCNSARKGRKNGKSNSNL